MWNRYNIFVVLVSFVLLISCDVNKPDDTGSIIDVQEATSFTLPADILEIPPTAYRRIPVIVPEGYAIPTSLQWTSADEDIATVSSNGVVTALMPGGVTVITASTASHSADVIVSIPDTFTLTPYAAQKRSMKRGVSFGFSATGDVELLQRGVSWSYNWGSRPSMNADADFQKYNMEFCPMVWNGNFNEDQYREYKKSHPECKYLLAFNEPNLTDQANMTPKEAAAQWPRVKALADELGWKIVSPAMNYGTLAGYSDPVKWLDEFFTLVPITDIAAISLHCYMTSPSGLMSYVQRFEKYNLPIWMTEFCAWQNGGKPESSEPQIRYMSQVVQFMETSPLVERYAWFIPRGTNGYGYELLDHYAPAHLRDAGKVFVGMSSYDTTTYHTADFLLAQEYSSSSVNPYPYLVASEDEGGELDVSAFAAGQYLEYLIDAAGTEQQLRLRYRAYLGQPSCKVLIDDKEVAVVEMPKTGGEYTWAEVPISMARGKHVLRLEMQTMNVDLHYLQFK